MRLDGAIMCGVVHAKTQIVETESGEQESRRAGEWRGRSSYGQSCAVFEALNSRSYSLLHKQAAMDFDGR